MGKATPPSPPSPPDVPADVAGDDDRPGAVGDEDDGGAGASDRPAGGLRLADQFLIAMPNMTDPNFAGAVIYMCEHSARGALGLVINRPTDLTMARLFDKIDLKLEIAPWRDAPVFFGGPVQTERGFVLHEPHGDYNSTLPVATGIALTTSKDVLEAVAEGKGPPKLLVTLGYAGWAAGQVESEIAQNAWLTVQADARVIFDTPSEGRFGAALALLGVDPAQLTGQAGHA